MKAPVRASIGDSCIRILINSLRDEGKRLSVLKDGVELQRVVEYDTEQGWALVHKLNKNGESFSEDGNVATERVTGRIIALVVVDHARISRGFSRG